MLVVSMRMNPRDASQKFTKFLMDYRTKGVDTHRKWVFAVLEYTVKYSRIDTGRSRSAWTPFMNLYGFDYFRSLPAGPRQTQDAVSQGMSQGTFVDSEFHTEIVNNVSYTEAMNKSYGLFGFSPGRERMGATNRPVKLSKGVRFEEKVVLFEDFGGKVWQMFLDNAKEAFEKHRVFDPDEIATVNPDPPSSP